MPSDILCEEPWVVAPPAMLQEESFTEEQQAWNDSWAPSLNTMTH